MTIQWPWKKTYGWATDPASLKVKCFKSSADTQIMGRLVSAERLSSFHDAELARCTEEINKILERAERQHKNLNEELAFLRVPGGLFLAWTENAISSEDDAEEINMALGIRARRHQDVLPPQTDGRTG